jgi:hypothetical protein
MGILKCGNCETCPAVAKIQRAASSMDHFSDHAIMIGTDPDLVADCGPEEIGILRHMVNLMREPEESPAETPEEVADAMRKTAGDITADLAERITALQEAADMVTQDCEGPLRMRAKKAGEIITVKVCMSPFRNPGTKIEPTEVTRITE